MNKKKKPETKSFVKQLKNKHIGRRTGENVKNGKNIRKFKDGFENFDDYWTESEADSTCDVSVRGKLVTKENNIVRQHGTTGVVNSTQDSIISSVSYGNGSKNTTYLRNKNIGRRTGQDVKAGKKIRRFDDGFENFDDYWSESEADSMISSFCIPKTGSKVLKQASVREAEIVETKKSHTAEASDEEELTASNEQQSDVNDENAPTSVKEQDVAQDAQDTLREENSQEAVTEDVPSTATEQETTYVTTTASDQEATEDVPTTACNQEATDVPTTASDQEATEDVPTTACNQEATDVPTTASDQEATEDVPTTACNQEATDVPTTASDQEATKDVPTTAHNQEATEDVPITPSDQKSTEDVPITVSDQEITEDVPITASDQEATEDVPITASDQKATDVPTTASDQEAAEDFPTTANEQESTEDVPTTANYQEATEGIPTTGSEQVNEGYASSSADKQESTEEDEIDGDVPCTVSPRETNPGQEKKGKDLSESASLKNNDDIHTASSHRHAEEDVSNAATVDDVPAAASRHRASKNDASAVTEIRSSAEFTQVSSLQQATLDTVLDTSTQMRKIHDSLALVSSAKSGRKLRNSISLKQSHGNMGSSDRTLELSKKKSTKKRVDTRTQNISKTSTEDVSSSVHTNNVVHESANIKQKSAGRNGEHPIKSVNKSQLEKLQTSAKIGKTQADSKNRDVCSAIQKKSQSLKDLVMSEKSSRKECSQRSESPAHDENLAKFKKSRSLGQIKQNATENTNTENLCEDVSDDVFEKDKDINKKKLKTISSKSGKKVNKKPEIEKISKLADGKSSKTGLKSVGRRGKQSSACDITGLDEKESNKGSSEQLSNVSTVPAEKDLAGNKSVNKTNGEAGTQNDVSIQNRNNEGDKRQSKVGEISDKDHNRKPEQKCDSLPDNEKTTRPNITSDNKEGDDGKTAKRVGTSDEENDGCPLNLKLSESENDKVSDYATSDSATSKLQIGGNVTGSLTKNEDEFIHHTSQTPMLSFKTRKRLSYSLMQDVSLQEKKLQEKKKGQQNKKVFNSSIDSSETDTNVFLCLSRRSLNNFKNSAPFLEDDDDNFLIVDDDSVDGTTTKQKNSKRNRKSKTIIGKKKSPKTSNASVSKDVVSEKQKRVRKPDKKKSTSASDTESEKVNRKRTVSNKKSSESEASNTEKPTTKNSKLGNKSKKTKTSSDDNGPAQNQGNQVKPRKLSNKKPKTSSDNNVSFQNQENRIKLRKLSGEEDGEAHSQSDCGDHDQSRETTNSSASKPGRRSSRVKTNRRKPAERKEKRVVSKQDSTSDGAIESELPRTQAGNDVCLDVNTSPLHSDSDISPTGKRKYSSISDSASQSSLNTKNQSRKSTRKSSKLSKRNQETHESGCSAQQTTDTTVDSTKSGPSKRKSLGKKKPSRKKNGKDATQSFVDINVSQSPNTSVLDSIRLAMTLPLEIPQSGISLHRRSFTSQQTSTSKTENNSTNGTLPKRRLTTCLVQPGSLQSKKKKQRRVTINKTVEQTFISPSKENVSQQPSMGDDETCIESLVHYANVTTTTTPTFESEVKKAKIIFPKSAPEGVRRSQRTRVQTLEWYKNERLIYDRRKSGCLITGIQPSLEQKYLQNKKVRRLKKPKGLRRLSKGRLLHPTNLSMHVDLPENVDLTYSTEVPIVNPDNQEEMMLCCFSKKEDFESVSPSVVDGKTNDSFQVSHSIRQPSVNSGNLILFPLAEKQSHIVDSQMLCFCVIYGKISVTIHRATCIVESGNHFFVPRGNSYSLKNLRNEEAKLAFFNFGSMEKDGSE